MRKLRVDRLDVIGPAHVGKRPPGGDEDILIGELRMAEMDRRERLLGHDPLDPESTTLVGGPRTWIKLELGFVFLIVQAVDVIAFQWD